MYHLLEQSVTMYFAHVVCLRVSYNSEEAAIISLNNISQLMFVTNILWGKARIFQYYIIDLQYQRVNVVWYFLDISFATVQFFGLI
jgi:hypothetical protein